MGSFSDYVEAKVLDQVFSATAYPTIATHYIALYTANPTDANASGTEVVGSVGYARVAVTNNATTWPAATGTAPTTKSNGIVITFGSPTGAGWGVVTGFAVYDASSSGNEIAWAALTASKTVNSGDAAPSFAIGALVITLD